MTYHGNEPIIPPISSGTSADDPHIASHAEMAAETDQTRMESLRQTVGELAPKITRLQSEQNNMQSWLKGGTVFIAVVLLIALVGIIIGYNVHRSQSQDAALIAQLQTQVAQLQTQQTRLDASTHETCNLYGSLLSFYNDAAKSRFASGPGAYDQVYIQLQNSSDRLGCVLKHVVPGT